MQIKLVALIAIASAAIHTSCDPAKTIRLVNTPSKELVVSIEMRKCPDRYRLGSNIGSAFNEAALNPRNEERDHQVYLGIGGWAEKDAAGLLSCIEEVRITGLGLDPIIASKENIGKYIDVTVTGTFSNYLDIKIKN